MSRTPFSALLVCLLCAGLPAAQKPQQPSTRPATLEMTGIDGRTYRPLDVTGRPATVLVFILQDCPICNGYAPQIERLAAQTRDAKVAWYVVHVDATLTVDGARRHAHDYGYTLPVLIDRQHELVRQLAVRAVPTAIVLDEQGAVRYRGRIDDQYVAIGKARTSATTHDLQDALTALLDHRPVPNPETSTIGCAVPDLPARNSK